MYRLISAFLIVMCHSCLLSQDFRDDSDRWIFGVFLNGVNNSGEALSRPFEIRGKYAFSQPVKLSIEKRFLHNFGAEISISSNRFTPGKLYNAEILDRSISYFSTDLVFKYYWTNLLFNARRSHFEGFILVGAGNMVLDSDRRTLGDLGGGFNIFLSTHFCLTFQGIGKVVIRNFKADSKLLQLDLGFVYRL